MTNDNNQSGENTELIDKLIEARKKKIDDPHETSKKKKDDLVLTGIYLQPDLARELDSLGKEGGRGAKSEIVNNALRKYFKEKGIL